MKVYFKVAVWFVIFETVFWLAGETFLNYFQEAIVYGNWSYAMGTPDSLFRLMISAFAVLFSVFCFAMFAKYMLLGVELAVRGEQ